jgi:hypothetical protein
VPSSHIVFLNPPPMCQKSKSYYHYLLNCQEGILTQVTLGSAKFSDCRNFGICRMNLMPKINNDGCKNRLFGYLRQDPPTGRLLLHFISSSVDQETYQLFFCNQAFRMEENFVLPVAIANKLNLTDRPVIIERGTYPVLKGDHFLTLSLRINAVKTPFKASSGTAT